MSCIKTPLQQLRHRQLGCPAPKISPVAVACKQGANVATLMVNHMVVPKSEALGCGDCHGKEGRIDWRALGYSGDPRAARK